MDALGNHFGVPGTPMRDVINSMGEPDAIITPRLGTVMVFVHINFKRCPDLTYRNLALKNLHQCSLISSCDTTGEVINLTCGSTLTLNRNMVYYH
jgi:hypothetical protein